MHVCYVCTEQFLQSPRIAVPVDYNDELVLPDSVLHGHVRGVQITACQKQIQHVFENNRLRARTQITTSQRSGQSHGWIGTRTVG